MLRKISANVQLKYIYYLLLVACFINSLYFLRDNKVKVLAILLFVSILTETLTEISIYRMRNYYVNYHLFTMVEYPLIAGILFQCIRSRIVRNLLLISMPLFVLACVVIFLFFQDIKQMPTISGGLEAALLIVWCLRAFYDLEVHGPDSIFQQAPFWFIIAFYSYYCIVTPYNSVFNTLQADPEYLKRSTEVYHAINVVGNCLLYILCIIGLSYLKRPKFIRRLS